MIRPLLCLALAAAVIGPVFAQPEPQQPVPQLGLEQRMLLRCSAAFAIGAQRQAAGDATALRWPALGLRGREFFVRASAQVMDEAALERPAIAALLESEARDIVARDTLEALMAACLPLLPPE